MADIQQKIKRITLEAEVIRADGTREPLGTVAEYQEDPKKRSIYLGGIDILNPELFSRYIRNR